jgi:hypothetical protein
MPPPGRLVLACRWEAEEIDETRADVDVAPILEAAARSELLWPDEGDGPDGESLSVIGFE